MDVSNASEGGERPEGDLREAHNYRILVRSKLLEETEDAHFRSVKSRRSHLFVLREPRLAQYSVRDVT
ncbi:hypothetical protein L249_1471 [Ophiocordyceps polyrhachis-furcata BCC 54312]|uniref:Uncharacterized protein n=1 Tax=Ophiocordyceps polyrhachis-furcata BCC 54312 TaxID=1330021 RepID=A0A367L4C6_9HYPO|nr:hypothetical protein L249_1471 [Ophiocordyceps polyrhachis-furcata BCC 54312]